MHLYCVLQAKQRNHLEAELHVQYGHHLFGEGDFEEALAQLGMSSGSNAISLLHLFPSLASPSLLQPLMHLTPGKPAYTLQSSPMVLKPLGFDRYERIIKSIFSCLHGNTNTKEHITGSCWMVALQMLTKRSRLGLKVDQ